MLVCATAITTHYIRAKKLLAILECSHRLYLCECRYISKKNVDIIMVNKP